MKKLLCVAAAAALLLSFAACGKAYNYDLSKYITLGQYKGVSVSASEIEESVQSQLDSLLKQKAETKDVTDRAAKDGDEVNIDYKGTIGGEPFDGGTASSDVVTLGSGQMIDGFESGIVGMTIGQTKTVTCTFPEDYTEELAGKTADFEITLNSIKETTLPELNDEFIAGLDNGYSTVDEYKAYLYDVAKSNSAWTSVVSSSNVIEYPKKELKSYYDNMVTYYQQVAASNGLSFDSYVQNYLGGTADSLLQMIYSYSQNYVKNQLVLNSIARAENITVDDATYKAKAGELADSYGYKSLKEYEKAAGKDSVKEAVLADMVQKLVADNAVVE
ncbi:MAG: trigger factor [Clostridiales bacterium]|nr:trigger factor [Clostridiales bacterium]